MCGGFSQQLAKRQIHDLYRPRGSELPLNFQPSYNGAPAQDFAVCRLDEDGNRGVAQLRWGLVALQREKLHEGSNIMGYSPEPNREWL